MCKESVVAYLTGKLVTASEAKEGHKLSARIASSRTGYKLHV